MPVLPSWALAKVPECDAAVFSSYSWGSGVSPRSSTKPGTRTLTPYLEVQGTYIPDISVVSYNPLISPVNTTSIERRDARHVYTANGILLQFSVMWGFPKIGVPFFGIPLLGFSPIWGIKGGTLFWGKCLCQPTLGPTWGSQLTSGLSQQEVWAP